MEDLIASRAITGALGNWMRASVEAAGLTEEAMKAVAKIDFSKICTRERRRGNMYGAQAKEWGW